MKLSRLLVLCAVVMLLMAYFAFDLGRYLSLDSLRAQGSAIAALRDTRPIATSLAVFAIYVAVTALSLPGATVMTLAAGATFGLAWGMLIVSFASSAGATLAMLVARFVAGDAIQQRYADKLSVINAGIARDGAYYLFTLRLVPLFPFFAINLLMGLTRIRAWTFYWVSQLGMLAGTLAYVNAGTQLAQLQSLQGILSPQLLGAFALLGVFPLIARKLVDGIRARRVYAGYKKPARFDRNLIVIGGGAAGLVTSYLAAAVKAKVTLIEKHRLGGDCLYTGCVPSKALIRSAKLASHLDRAGEFGFESVSGKVNFARVMQRVQDAIKQIEPHDSVERYTQLGVECIQGEARLIDPWTVEVNGQQLTARDIVIATGAEPLIPQIPGLADCGYLTSETLWSLRERPQRLIVLGGGPIGCELAQAMARLGSAVTLVEMLPRLMVREDPEFSEAVRARFVSEGIDLRLGVRASAIVREDGEQVLLCGEGETRQRISFDKIIVAVGRAARLKGFGLEKLGVRCDKTIEVNPFLQTNYPNIWACGDVAGPFQFTHTAAHMAWYAAVNSLFAPLLPLRGGRFAVDYSVIPWATFTDPEVARVGLNETDAKARGIACEVTTYNIDDLDRAIVDGEAHGLVKVLTVPGKDRILGVTIMGEHAGDLIAEYVLAMRNGIGLNKILGTIHIYPTLAEANKYAAGRWKQAHKPESLLRWVERYHTWRRG